MVDRHSHRLWPVLYWRPGSCVFQLDGWTEGRMSERRGGGKKKRGKNEVVMGRGKKGRKDI